MSEKLQLAFAANTLADRLDAIKALGAAQSGGYAGQVLTARAAARIAPVDLSDDDARTLVAAMLAGGLDRNAIAWVPHVNVGSGGWALLAVGSPIPLAGVTPRQVASFAGNDDSTDGVRTRFLAAALLALGRVRGADAISLATDHHLQLGATTRWTRAIDDAADRGEAGTVALLSGVGLLGSDWRVLPPYHLYHIIVALRRVGLSAEARMIAAEALTRV